MSRAETEMQWAVGLMSGTSLDGIDAALIRSDGAARVETGAFLSFPYDRSFRTALRGVLGCDTVRYADRVAPVARELTLRHAAAVRSLLARAGMPPERVRVVGFHGHTTLHEPQAHRTCQIGDGALLAQETGLDVVCDFRQRDVAAGGEGAPFAPLYHAALASAWERPVAILNIGGVANVTWIGEGEAGEGAPPPVIAFDTGPGNALIDDWAERCLGEPIDRDGALAAAGRVDAGALARLMDNAYFQRPPPKSLDREDFAIEPVARLGAADGAATLTAFTAAAVAAAARHFPAPARRWLVTGGGRHNGVLMAVLAARLGVSVDPIEAAGCDGDALEAQAFAYLALRSLRGLPLSLPSTTGVPRPMTGGVLHHPRRAA